MLLQVGIYGDSAPRRPRLRTAQVFKLSQIKQEAGYSSSAFDGAQAVAGSGTVVAGGDLELSREEIAADMRIIAGECISFQSIAVYGRMLLLRVQIITLIYACVTLCANVFVFRISADGS